MNRMVFFEGLDRTVQSALFQQLRSWRRDKFVYFEHGPWLRYAISDLRGDPIATVAARSLVNKARPLSVVICVLRNPADLPAPPGARGADWHEKAKRAQERLSTALRDLPPAHLIEVDYRAAGGTEQLVTAAKEALAELINDDRGAGGTP